MSDPIVLHVIRPPDAIDLCDIAQGIRTATAKQRRLACDLLTAVNESRKEIQASQVGCNLCCAPITSTVGLTYCCVLEGGRHGSRAVVCAACTERLEPDDLYAQCGDSLSQHLLGKRGDNVVHEAGHA